MLPNFLRLRECASCATPNPIAEIPIANPSEVRDALGSYRRNSLFLMWFSQIGTQQLYVWNKSFEDAWETAVEWLDDQGYCGYFTTIDESDLRDAARDLYLDDAQIEEAINEIQRGRIESRNAKRVLEAAEADLTMVGHTTLRRCEEKFGSGPLYVPNWEWGGGKIQRRTKTFREVVKRSVKEAKATGAW